MSEYVFPVSAQTDTVQPMEHVPEQRTQSVVTQAELKGVTDEINQRTNLRLSIIAGRTNGADASGEACVSAQPDLSES